MNQERQETPQNQAFIIDHMKENNFYNTTNLKGVELLGEKTNAKSLQAKVLNHFKKCPKQGFIWSDIATILGVSESQYGSIKRCLTNLSTTVYSKTDPSIVLYEAELYMSTNQKVSIYGKKAHFYFLVQ